MENLVIVESPNKKATIEKYLGPGWQVEASFGHIADLPKTSMGFEFDSFEPDYDLSDKGQERVKKLKNLAQSADTVWLATDPDREGEAIAEHLKRFLKLKNYHRITFNEITEKAVKSAVKNPREINQHLFKAQEARRVIDRLVGYQVSPRLCKMTDKKLSAGRVQSPAVKLLVERERAIRNFKPTNHFGVKVLLKSEGHRWAANWYTKPFIEDETNPYILERSLAEQVANIKDLVVTEHEVKKGSKTAPAPFITTTLQKAASLKLGLDAEQTMQMAQTLFEKGLITYHRTDNPNLSKDVWDSVGLALDRLSLKDHQAEKLNTFKTKANAQEAHEAIRPTDLTKESVDLGNDTLEKLYTLIRVRALASQMKPAETENTKISLKAKDVPEGLKEAPSFVAQATKTTYLGWQHLTEKDESDENSKEVEENTLPKVSKGDEVVVQSSKVLELTTKAPSRYSEAALITQLEKRGIGRPSTYAAILKNIKTRGYVNLKGKSFFAEADGEIIYDALNDKFDFMDLGFTKLMEDNLDEIAKGDKNYLSVVKSAFDSLDKNLKKLPELDIHVETHPCPKCESGKLRRLKGKSSYFWGCSGYKDGTCKHIEDDVNGKPLSQLSKDDIEHPCPSCGKALLRKKGKYGHFWGCVGFRDGCKTMVDDDGGKPLAKHDCPKCGKHLRKLKGSKGVFWGCSGYKEGCKTSFPNLKGKPDLSKSVA